MNRLLAGLLIAAMTARVWALGITGAGASLVAQAALVFAGARWFAHRRIERHDDQVLISDDNVVTWYNRSEHTEDSIADLQRFGREDHWPTWFPIPEVGNTIRLRNGKKVIITEINYDIATGMNVIEAEEI